MSPPYKQPRLKAAIQYSRMGLSIVPADPKTGEPLVPLQDFQANQPSEAQLRDWWDEWPDAVPFLVCGKVSGVVAFSVDNPSRLRGPFKRFGPLKTAITRTPSNGRIRLFPAIRKFVNH